MKNTMKYIKAVLVAAVAFSGVSCEKFLSADPIDKVEASKFFKSENELMLYANGLINSYMPDAVEVGLDGDRYCDFVCTKTSEDYNRPGVWGSNKQGGWDISSWRGIRRANILLDKLPNSRANVSETVYNHYEGVGRFWRAYLYFAKMRTFGDVPWTDHALSISEEAILKAPRTDREELFHHILEDLNFACENLQYKGYEHVINKYVALALKSRVCLYEGTYRKYHTVNPSTKQPWNGNYESATEILEECVSACEELMTSGKFALTTGNPWDTANGCYAKIWRNTDLLSNNEAIWVREYDYNLAVTHELTWRVNSGTYDQQPAPTKNYVNMFLKLNGQPIDNEGKVSLKEEFKDRDYRLVNTVNHDEVVNSDGHTVSAWTYTATNGSVSPKPAYMSSYTYTGYNFIKWSVEREENFSKGRADNDIPVFRYAEVLLNYAEAKEELGAMTAEIWEKTVGALRVRAGIEAGAANALPTTVDPWLAAYYSVSPLDLNAVKLEIRRERVCELAMEHLRIDDLYRWHCGNIVVNRGTENAAWRGIWVTADEANVANGLQFNGNKYTFPTDGSKPKTGMGFPVSNNTANSNYSFSEGDHGYIMYNYKLEWNDRMYVHPIPDSANTLNPALGQNPDW